MTEPVIDEKDLEIARLRAQIQEKNSVIATLQSVHGDLKGKIALVEQSVGVDHANTVVRLTRERDEWANRAARLSEGILDARRQQTRELEGQLKREKSVRLRVKELTNALRPFGLAWPRMVDDAQPLVGRGDYERAWKALTGGKPETG